MSRHCRRFARGVVVIIVNSLSQDVYNEVSERLGCPSVEVSLNKVLAAVRKGGLRFDEKLAYITSVDATFPKMEKVLVTLQALSGLRAQINRWSNPRNRNINSCSKRRGSCSRSNRSNNSTNK